MDINSLASFRLCENYCLQPTPSGNKFHKAFRLLKLFMSV